MLETRTRAARWKSPTNPLSHVVPHKDRVYHLFAVLMSVPCLSTAHNPMEGSLVCTLMGVLDFRITLYLNYLFMAFKTKLQAGPSVRPVCLSIQSYVYHLFVVPM